MNDRCTYQIEVRGQIDENALNATSPIQMTAAQVDGSATRLTVCTDQSGLVGLIRYLHSRGLVLLSVYSDRSGIVVNRGAHSPQNRKMSSG